MSLVVKVRSALQSDLFAGSIVRCSDDPDMCHHPDSTPDEPKGYSQSEVFSTLLADNNLQVIQSDELV